MASNLALAGMNSTTFEAIGISLPKIMSTVISKTSEAVKSFDLTDLYLPLHNMEAFAKESTTNNSAVINNALVNAYNMMDASLITYLPGTGHSLLEIQNASSHAIGYGIVSFGLSLQTIDYKLSSEALCIGNSAIVKANETSDILCFKVYEAARHRVAEQVVLANIELVKIILSENAAASLEHTGTN